MPIVIPPFNQYQAPLVPLRGLWHAIPPEGDKFVSAEIDWFETTDQANCVQLQLTSNSPVALSWIAALNVDNSQCGSDVQFIFPDSSFILVVPGYNQGLYPVFTNALQFYCLAESAAPGDRTLFQILNSIPPPVAIQPTLEQESVAAQGVALATNQATPVIAAPTSGTLTGFSILASASSAGTPSTAEISLVDGTGRVLWTGQVTFNANAAAAIPINITGLRVRFFQGVNLVVAGSNVTAGTASVNLYYSLP